MSVGSVLQEMAKRQELAPMLLTEIRITRKKRANPVDAQNDESKEQKDKPVTSLVILSFSGAVPILITILHKKQMVISLHSTP